MQGTGKWYELQDLQVTDILPQMITLSEAYIQVSAWCFFCCPLKATGLGGSILLDMSLLYFGRSGKGEIAKKRATNKERELCVEQARLEAGTLLQRPVAWVAWGSLSWSSAFFLRQGTSLPALWSGCSTSLWLVSASLGPRLPSLFHPSLGEDLAERRAFLLLSVH